jgi:hypothetical protein
VSVPPYAEDPGNIHPTPKVDAGRLWTGGLATAAVAALVALVGVLIARGLFDVPLLAPTSEGTLGDASTAGLAGLAAGAALLATGLMHLLLLSTPRPGQLRRAIWGRPRPHPTRRPHLADAAGGHPGEDGLSGLLLSGGGRHAETCAARPCGTPSSRTSNHGGDGSRHCLVAAAAVSMACNSLASSAPTSPIATRSSGLMNPSLSRNPPARAIASRNGTAQ